METKQGKPRIVVQPGGNLNLTIKGKYIQIGGEDCHNEITVQQFIGNHGKADKLFAQTQISLDCWEKQEGEVFIPTRALEKGRDILNSHGHVNIFGLSGHGKTTLAMKLIQESSRKAIILRRPEDWEELDIEKETPIVLLDDVLGKFELDKFSKEKWLSRFYMMFSCVKEGKLQVITTCRETTFALCQKELAHYGMFEETSCIHLNHIEYDLNEELKMQMFTKYLNSNLAAEGITICDNRKEENLSIFKISKITLEDIAKTKTNLGFPECCRLFVTRPQCFLRGVKFFEEPVEAVILEIDRMRDSDNQVDKYNYCTLVCVLLFDGLSDENIESMGDSSNPSAARMQRIARACRIKSILSSEILLAARRLSTSYLSFAEETYHFEHNCIAQAVFTSFSKCQPKLLIEYCEQELLYNLVSTKGTVSDADLLYVLPVRHYDALSARLILGLVETTDSHLYKNLWKVVSHRIMSDEEFVEKFWLHIETDPSSKSKLLQATNGGSDILLVSGRVSSGCFVGRTIETLQKTIPRKKLEEEMSRVLYGACVYDNYEVCEYLMKHYNHWESRDISDALWQACHNSKFRCYKALIDYNVCNKRSIVTQDVLSIAAREARNGKGEEIANDIRSRGFELPESQLRPIYPPSDFFEKY